MSCGNINVFKYTLNIDNGSRLLLGIHFISPGSKHEMTSYIKKTYNTEDRKIVLGESEESVGHIPDHLRNLRDKDLMASCETLGL